MASKPDPLPAIESPLTTMRLFHWAITGFGLLMIIGDSGLLWWWWNTLTGGMEEWRKNWWQISILFIVLFGALSILFVVLQTLRAEVRTNPSARRALYGYNAAFGGILLLAILFVVNVMA